MHTCSHLSVPQYFPAPVSKTDGLKACVVDQRDDNEVGGESYDFYKSSLALQQAWLRAGMRADASLSARGGHCETHSFEWIASCLDDGTGRLLSAPAE